MTYDYLTIMAIVVYTLRYKIITKYVALLPMCSLFESITYSKTRKFIVGLEENTWMLDGEKVSASSRPTIKV